MKSIAGTLSRLFMAITVLLLPFSNVISVNAGANQCTWSGAGGDNNWSTSANWGCSVGSVPSDGYDLIFPYVSTNEMTNNDLVATNIYGGIWFTGTVPNNCDYGVIYDVDGNGIRLGSSGINVQTTNGCSKTIVINNPITLMDATTFDINNLGNEASLETHDLALGANDLAISSIGIIPPAYQGVTLSGVKTGSGNITVDGDLGLYGASPSFSGNISIQNGNLTTGSDGLGDATGTTTVGNNSSIGFSTCVSSYTIAENITFSGAGWSYGNGGPSAKLHTEKGCGGGSPTEIYTSYYSSETITLSGSLTLSSDITVGPTTNLTVSGSLLGATRTATLVYDANPATYFYGGNLNITAGTNTTATTNGTYRNPVRSTTLADSQPANTVLIGALSIVTITGTRSDISLTSGGILRGTGTVALISSYGGTIDPGMSPGILNSGDVNYDSETVHIAELGGTASGDYDQLNVTGTVSLGNATLTPSLYGGFAPSLSNTFTIVNNDGADAVTGTFGGLAQGAEVSLSGYKFTISYTGGTGNDVVLTTTYVPGPPGTGFNLVRANTVTPIAISILGLTIFVLAGRMKKKGAEQKD